MKRGAEQWRVLLSRFDGSGLCVAEFCAREGISDTSFHRWRSRLRAAGSSQPERAAPAVFLDAGVLRREPPSAARLELTLDLGGGLQLSLVRG
ncbi:MAG: IS66 family insertion sequence element accessory protein TnpB [Accumulibacter sp.]